MLLLLLGVLAATENQYKKRPKGVEFGLSLKGWGYDMLSTSCLRHYLNKIDMSIKKVNKIYTNTLNNDIVRLIIDRSLTKAMDKAIINNNNKGMSLNISQMKEDLSAKA